MGWREDIISEFFSYQFLTDSFSLLKGVVHRLFVNTPPRRYKLQRVRLHVRPLSKALSVPSTESPTKQAPNSFVLRGTEYQSDSWHRVPETTYHPNGRWSPVNINIGKHLAAGFIASSGPSCLLSQFLGHAGPRTRDKYAPNPSRPTETFEPQELRRPRRVQRHSRILQMERDYLVESRGWLVVGLSFCCNLTPRDERNVPSIA